jgi:hypothetical protein
MSAAEEIAKKYSEDMLQFAPAACVASFLVGIVLFNSSVLADQGDASAWVYLLSQKYGKIWFFLDILRSLKIITVVTIAGCSYVSLIIFRFVTQRLFIFGVSTQLSRIENIYRELKVNARADEINGRAYERAEKWYKSKELRVLKHYKIGVFLCGLSLQSLLVFLWHLKFLDIVVAFAFALAALLEAYFFGLEYYRAVLPRRLMLDASLGLPSVNFLRDFDDV